MSKRVKVDGRTLVVPDDATLDEIDQISKGGSVPAPPPHEIQASPKPFSKSWWKEGAYNLADKVTNVLPAAGGIVGGILGGGGGTLAEPGGGTILGAAGGAAAGGAAGESARQLLRSKIFPRGQEAQQTPGAALKDIGVQGAEQGAYELGGRGLAAGAKALAPHVAETALAPGKRLLKSIPENVNIGRTALDETTANAPKEIAGQLDTKITASRAAKESALATAKNNGVQMPLDGPQNIVAGEQQAALLRNNPEYLKDVSGLRDQITRQMDVTGRPVGPLPPLVDPVRYDALRQGVDTTIGNFNPESASAIAPTAKMMRGTMARDLHAAVPEAIEPDAAMTRMIPTRDAAWNTAFNPGITKSLVERFARPTGALFGAGAGAYEGGKYGGAPGAIAGGLLGAAGPIVVSSPRFLMNGARLLDNSAPAIRGLRTAVPLGLSQINDKENAADEE